MEWSNAGGSDFNKDMFVKILCIGKLYLIFSIEDLNQDLNQNLHATSKTY